MTPLKSTTPIISARERSNPMDKYDKMAREWLARPRYAGDDLASLLRKVAKEQREADAVTARNQQEGWTPEWNLTDDQMLGWDMACEFCATAIRAQKGQTK